MAVKKLIDFLDQNQVDYQMLHHFRTYTAQETAASVHIKGMNLAKTVMLKVDGEMIMVVLPAPYKVDLKRIKEITGAKAVEIAKESELQEAFPDCSIGAMPPFGNLYHVDVYADKDLTKDQEIAFNAGNHEELVKIPYKVYEKLVHPHMATVHRVI